MTDIIPIILTYKNELSELSEEIINAICIDENQDLFQIVEPPLFALLAVGDIVNVEYENNKVYADNLVNQSDNSTIHIISLNRKSIFDNVLLKDTLDDFNLMYRYVLDKTYMTVNIPKDFNYQNFYSILMKLENENTLSFKESVLSQKHRDDIRHI